MTNTIKFLLINLIWGVVFYIWDFNFIPCIAFIIADFILFYTFRFGFGKNSCHERSVFFDRSLITSFIIMINVWFTILSAKFCKSNFIAYAICFIAFDILFILLDKLEVKLAANFFVRSDYTERSVESFLEDNFKKVFAYNIFKRYKKTLEEIERNKTVEVTKKDRFAAIIKQLSDYPYDENPVPDKEYKDVLQEIKLLTSQINEQERLLDYINIGRFELYSNEFITFLDSSIKIDLDKNPEYMSKIQKAIKTYKNYIDDILKEIESKLKMEIDVNYKVLNNLIERKELNV